MTYQVPMLVLIGAAKGVVLGVPGAAEFDDHGTPSSSRNNAEL